MKYRKRSGSGLTTHMTPCRVIIDFFAAALDEIPTEDIELILGTLLYGVITNTTTKQYGLLVKYFVDNGDGPGHTPLSKLTYVDKIFIECHKNVAYFEPLIDAYSGYNVAITDVSYDKVGCNVSFRVEDAGEEGLTRWVSDIPRASRELCPHGRPLLRRR